MRIPPFLCVVFLAFAAPAGAAPALPSIDSEISGWMQRWEIPGCAVAFAKAGKLVYAKGYGMADKDAQRAVTPDTLFRIASLSKPVTAVAILKLVEEGKLGLDDKAFALLKDFAPPEGKTADPRLADITIRELLNHSAGWDIKAMGYDPQFTLSANAADATATARPADGEAIVRYMMGEPLSTTPGEHYAYSNLGYNVLGRIIEGVTGRGYEDYVRQSVLAPMGITRMQLGHSLLNRRAEGETLYFPPSSGKVQSVFPGTGDVAWPDGGWSLEAMDSHGGWIASAVDMVHFITHVDGLPGPADILKEETIRTMTARPEKPDYTGQDSWYALGWSVRPAGGDANWWHTGSLDGTTTIMVRTHNGMAWCALANKRPKDSSESDGELDRALWAGVNGVTTWPEPAAP